MLNDEKQAKKALFKAVETGDSEAIEKAAKENSENLGITDSSGSTLLHKAILKKNEEIVRILLENSANLDFQNEYGVTPRDLAKDKDKILDIIAIHQKQKTLTLDQIPLSTLKQSPNNKQNTKPAQDYLPTIIKKNQRKIREQCGDYLLYLTFMKGRDKEEIEKIIKFFNDLEGKQEIGFCYALCIIRGAMRAIEKLNWWMGGLVEIIKWEGTPEELNEEINLPDAKETLTLDKLFNRVIHYLISCQLGISYLAKNPVQGIYGIKGHRKKRERLFFFKTFYDQQRQFDITDPRQPYFELLGDNGAIKIAEERYITEKVPDRIALKNLLIHLAPFLESDPNIICTIIEGMHALDLYYADGHWALHDPNYDHEKPENMTKNFNSNNLDKLIDELDNCFANVETLSDKPHFELVFLSGYNPKKILQSINQEYFLNHESELLITLYANELKSRDKSFSFLKPEDKDFKIPESSSKELQIIQTLSASPAESLDKLCHNSEAKTNLEEIFTALTKQDGNKIYQLAINAITARSKINPTLQKNLKDLLEHLKLKADQINPQRENKNFKNEINEKNFLYLIMANVEITLQIAKGFELEKEISSTIPFRT